MTNNQLKGLAPDSELETNANGAIQSKSHYAAHLLDAVFLMNFTEDKVLEAFAEFMLHGSCCYIVDIIKALLAQVNMSEYQALLKISEVRHVGTYEKGYQAFNWKDIPQESHLNHAMVHWLAYKSGDTQDDHVGHCLCRLMFAYSTNCSEGYTYTRKQLQKDTNND